MEVFIAKTTVVPGNPYYGEGGRMPSTTGNPSGGSRGNNPAGSSHSHDGGNSGSHSGGKK